MTIQSRRHPKPPQPTPQPITDTPVLQASVQQAQLKRALALVSHAVAPKSALPVLTNVLLLANDAGRLRISATNLEIGIAVTLAAGVAQAGAIALPAKLLLDVVSALPNEIITLEMEQRTQSVTLTCGRFVTTIKGVEAEEFPIIPTSVAPPIASFAPEALCSAVAQVAFAAASDDTRPILTGVQLALAGVCASFAAADTFRLAFREIVLDRPVVRPQAIVVPARAMITLGKILADAASPVELRIDGDGNRVLFRTDELELVARAIDGRYPDISPYLRSRPETVLELSTGELAKAVRLAAYFAVTSANIIRLVAATDELGAGTVTISANASEVGDNTSTHAAAVRGAGGSVALNVRFLADGIAAIATAAIAIQYISAQQPVVLRGVGDETYTYVAMPMALA